MKWVDRPQDPNGVFQTAVELETPSNIWGIDSPPQDWLPFTGARTLEMDTSKPKPFAVPRPEVSASAAGDKGLRDRQRAPHPSDHSQHPQVLGPLANSWAIFSSRWKACSLKPQALRGSRTLGSGHDVAELRVSLREEAKQVLSEASASQAGPWIEQSIKQLNKASQESARILYGQWKKKLETDVQQALERVDQRGRELEESSQSLAMKAAERVQGVLESSRKEGVGRIVARLKEQMAPSIDNALKVTSDLAKHKSELEKAARAID